MRIISTTLIIRYLIYLRYETNGAFNYVMNEQFRNLKPLIERTYLKEIEACKKEGKMLIYPTLECQAAPK